MSDALLATINNDENSKFPAFIELILVNQITDLTKEALRHVLNTFSDRFVDNHDAINAILSLIFHAHSYSATDAGIIEGVYGLKRVNCDQDGKLYPLKKYQRIASIAIESIVPYILSSVDTFAARQRTRSIETLSRLLNHELRHHSHVTLHQYRAVRLTHSINDSASGTVVGVNVPVAYHTSAPGVTAESSPSFVSPTARSRAAFPRTSGSRRLLHINDSSTNSTTTSLNRTPPLIRQYEPTSPQQQQHQHQQDVEELFVVVEDVEGPDGSQFTTVIFTPDTTPVRGVNAANQSINEDSSQPRNVRTDTLTRFQGRWPWLNRLRRAILLVPPLSRYTNVTTTAGTTDAVVLSSDHPHHPQQQRGEQEGEDTSPTTILWTRIRWASYVALLWLLRLKSRLKFHTQAAAVLFGRLFPYLKAAYKLLLTAQKMLYLFGRTPYVHPVLGALNIAIVKRTAKLDNILSDPNKPIDIDISSSGVEADARSPSSSSSSSSSTTSSAAAAIPAARSYDNNDNSSSDSDSDSGGGAAMYNWKAVAVMGALIAIRVAESLIRMDETATNNNNNHTTTTADGGGEASTNSNTSPLLGMLSRLGVGAIGRRGNIVAAGAGATQQRTVRRIPPPPSAPKTAPGCVIPPRDGRLCPLCRKPRVNPCASTGGFTFCYNCLIEAVRDTPQCPVTALPCNESDILRLYEDNRSIL